MATVGQSSPSVDTLTPDSVSTLVDVSVYETKEQAAKALIEFLVTRYVTRSVTRNVSVIRCVTLSLEVSLS